MKHVQLTLVVLAAAPWFLWGASSTAMEPQRGGGTRGATQGDPGPMPAGGWTHEFGVLGTEFPQPKDVRFGDALVNQDQSGGAEQVLHALSASPRGFAAVWRDTRHGNLGLFLGRLDPEGVVIGEEQPVHAPRTSRQVEPSIGAAGPLAGAVAWFAMDGGVQQVNLRFFTGEEGVRGPVYPLGTATGRNTAEGVARVDPGLMTGSGVGEGAGLANRRASRAPALAFSDDGSGLVVWREGARLFGRTVAPGLGAKGPVFPIDPEGPGIDGDPLASGDGGGRYAVAWARGEQVGLWTAAGEQRSAAVVAGRGTPIALAPAPEGWWILARVGDRVHLRLVGQSGAPVLSEQQPAEGAVVDASLATWDGGLLLSLEGPATGQATPPRRVLTIAPDGTQREWEIPFPADWGASGVRVAARGQRAIVAWTDRRNGDPDVYFRVLHADGSVGEAKRWNTDQASADQTSPAIASDGAQRAVIAWEDRRMGEAVLYARRLNPTGFSGDEFPVGDGELPGDARSPALAVGADGGFALVWNQSERGRLRTYARAYGPKDEPLGPAMELGSHSRTMPWRAAVKALPGGDFVALHAAEGNAGRGSQLLATRLRGAQVLSQRVLAQSQGELRYPNLALLDDGRLLAAWDESNRGSPARLAAQFLTQADMSPLGPPLAFHPTPEPTGDWDPAIAPAPGGGFAMAWTGNESPTRDVFARTYDRSGRPVSVPVAVSYKANEQDYAEILRLSDGSFVVVWEDDISYRDHLQARRYFLDGRAGPEVTVNQRETLFVPDRTMPDAAVLGDGFAVVWSDRRRGLGHDVYVRVLGPGFDRDLDPSVVVDPR